MINLIDLIVLLLLIYAFWRGWSGGLLMQISGIAGVLLGVWGSYHFGDMLASWWGIAGGYRTLLIIAMILATVITVSILSRLLTRVLSAGGLSFGIKLAGAVFSAGKYILLLSLTLIFAEWIVTLHLFRGIHLEYLAEALCYEPLQAVSHFVFPYIDQLGTLARQIM